MNNNYFISIVNFLVLEHKIVFLKKILLRTTKQKLTEIERIECTFATTRLWASWLYFSNATR